MCGCDGCTRGLACYEQIRLATAERVLRWAADLGELNRSSSCVVKQHRLCAGAFVWRDGDAVESGPCTCFCHMADRIAAGDEDAIREVLGE